MAENDDLTPAERRELDTLRQEKREAEIRRVAREAAGEEVSRLERKIEGLEDRIAELTREPEEGEPGEGDDDDDELPDGREVEPEPAEPAADEIPERKHPLHRRIIGKK